MIVLRDNFTDFDDSNSELKAACSHTDVQNCFFQTDVKKETKQNLTRDSSLRIKGKK